MINEDHGNSVEENSSGESVEEVSPTQNEVNDEDFCEKTQPEIQFAELRYEGSLLQNSIWPEVLKIPLPTATEREISVLFGRQENGGPSYNIFVKLHDISRNSKQPASRHHSLLRLHLDEQRPVQARQAGGAAQQRGSPQAIKRICRARAAAKGERGDDAAAGKGRRQRRQTRRATRRRRPRTRVPRRQALRRAKARAQSREQEEGHADANARGARLRASH